MDPPLAKRNPKATPKRSTYTVSIGEKYVKTKDMYNPN